MDANPEYYRVFCHAAKNSSLTSAARELSVSQPAVSRQIHALEESLGAKLFIRTAGGIHLTQEGKPRSQGAAQALLKMIEEDQKGTGWQSET